jgi:hypothetical protein
VTRYEMPNVGALILLNSGTAGYSPFAVNVRIRT